MPVKEKEIAEEIMRLGIRPDIKGYRFLLEAVRLRIENPTGGFCKDIYEGVAKKFNTTTSRVERAIRHSIECAHELNNPAWQDFCKNSWSGQDKPNNGWVIATIAEMHRLSKVS